MSAAGGGEGQGGGAGRGATGAEGATSRPGVVRVRERAAKGREAATVAGPDVRSTRIPLSRERIASALRSVESKRETPHVHLGTTVDLGPCTALLEERDGTASAPGRVEIQDVVLAACAGALGVFPSLNGRFAGDAIETWEEIHLAFSVAVGDALAWPVLRSPARLPIDALAALRGELARRARSGELTAEDESGSTFSVLLLGEFGVDTGQSVIRPPQAGLLSVGRPFLRPVVRDHAVEAGWVVSLGLACDRRIVEEPLGGRFLAEVRRRIEQPAMLLGE